MHKRYGDRVQFLAVYVREAHPTDGWRAEGNDRVGIRLQQPRKKGERLAVATKCCSTLEMTMPLLVDEMDDRVGHAYSGMPDRLYVIDRDGRVAYKGGRGPFGFKTREMEQSLIMLLLDQAPISEPSAHGIPLLSDAAACQRLPLDERGGVLSLPLWARALAASRPRTTAAMLELDFLHRMRSPLDPKLHAKLRWVAAHANRCAYSEAYARADLCRAGGSEANIQALENNSADLPAAERAALMFARKLTLAADTVTDAEVAQLIGYYGDKQVVAMVLLLAYANFQDRLILALGLPLEPGGPLPPREIRFAKGAPPVGAQKEAPPRTLPSPAAVSVPAAKAADSEWLSLNFGDLQKEMAGQRAREPRIPVPSWEEVRKHLPAGYPANKPLRIRWSLVCLGYQPELATGWSACTRAFAEEAEQDRVFEESLFWIVTRTLHCFY